MAQDPRQQRARPQVDEAKQRVYGKDRKECPRIKMNYGKDQRRQRNANMFVVSARKALQ